MFRVEDFWKQNPVGNVDDGDTERTSDNCESSWFYRASVKNSSKFQKNRNGFSEFNYASAFWFLDGYDYVVNCSDSYRWDEKQLVASGFASYNMRANGSCFSESSLLYQFDCMKHLNN